MNEEKLKQILNEIGRTDVPPNIARIAEQTSQSFTAALNILQTRRQPFFIGFKRIAVAASILLVFALGLSVGRWSKPPQTQVSSLDLSPVLTHPAVHENGFWRQKALAAMQPRPYAQNELSQTALLNAYKQYLKEKTL
jgi:hypothetical protein